MLESEKISVAAPMSFAGSTGRLWRLQKRSRVYLLAVLPALPFVWLTVALWYLAFGLVIVPYRLMRRGARKRRLEDARHRELLAQKER